MFAQGRTPALPSRASNINAQRPIEHTDTVLLDVGDVDEWIGDSASPHGKDVAPRKAIETIKHLCTHQRLHAAQGTA